MDSQIHQESPPTLSQQTAGFNGNIAAIEGGHALVERFYELGFIPGTYLSLEAILPFGGAFIVQLNGTVVALRREEAACIQLQKS